MLDKWNEIQEKIRQNEEDIKAVKAKYKVLLDGALEPFKLKKNQLVLEANDEWNRLKQNASTVTLDDIYHRLSPREREVIDLERSGYKASAIAERFGVTTDRIRQIRRKIDTKVNQANRRHQEAFALEIVSQQKEQP